MFNARHDRSDDAAKTSRKRSGEGLLLHHGGRNGGGRARDPHAGAGVDDGNRVAGAESRGLMDLHRLGGVGLEAGRGGVGIIRGGRQGEGGSDLLTWLGLLLHRGRVGRAAGKGTVGGGRVD